MNKNYSRICIIGGPGTGKTSLSYLLGKKLNLPVFHLDAFQFLSNWKLCNKTERDSLILETANKEEWILEGTYLTTLEQRIILSDCIIFLDYSTFSQLKGVLKRWWLHYEDEKPELSGCREKITIPFLLKTLFFNAIKRKSILTLLKKHPNSKVLWFRSQKQLTTWLNKNYLK